MSELSLFAMQSFSFPFFSWALQSLIPFAKGTSHNSSFYANERVKGSLCSLPSGEPNPPTPLTSPSTLPEWARIELCEKLFTVVDLADIEVSTEVIYSSDLKWMFWYIQTPSLGRREEEKVNGHFGCLGSSSNFLEKKRKLPGPVCYLLMKTVSKAPGVAVT